MIYLLGCLVVSVCFLCVYFSGIGFNWMYKLKKENGRFLIVVIGGMILLSWITVFAFCVYYIWKKYAK